MGAKASKRYPPPLKSLLNPLKRFLTFLSVVPTKVLFLIFEILIFFLFFRILFSFSLTWDYMGAKTSKRYSSLKSLLNRFNLSLNFLLSDPDKSTVLDFLNFKFPIF